ncbi:Hypothetical predicted protein [Octopus vulgaris]|uniref:Uncharacterized protein n=1 Tax=Octopus vulgaris TaxID=6645 RepID=A0AA36EWH9_OCTVU|nr:Hypothetical predicted protein [Octopus vulgaris]
MAFRYASFNDGFDFFLAQFANVAFTDTKKIILIYSERRKEWKKEKDNRRREKEKQDETKKRETSTPT